MIRQLAAQIKAPGEELVEGEGGGAAHGHAPYRHASGRMGASALICGLLP
jgi:hypothetical protein